MPIGDQKQKALSEKMKKRGLFEKDIEERFVRASGKGGQKVNKTSSCVHLRHVPSGLEVRCQETRSQADNRFYARRLLCEKYEGQILKIKTEKRKQSEKLKRQKRKRSKRAKEKMLRDKKNRSDKKKMRQKPGLD